MTLIAGVLAGSLLFAPWAWAYSEVATTAPNVYIDPADCASCHSESSVEVTSTAGTGYDRQGPHSNYTATSRSCAGCHQVHSAPADGYVLLPGPTIVDTCKVCHDGTQGGGVYGAIEARGLTVGSAHRTEATSLVPGGDFSTGGAAVIAFAGSGGTLSCGDCHTPHGAAPVASFTSDRMRTTGDTAGFLSDKLLKQRPTSVTTSTPVYGSDWCAGCHEGRISEHAVINHPVDAGMTVGPSTFIYENVARVRGTNTPLTETGTLGRSNFGYVMPWPRTTDQGEHAPICQQCHEDARNVGDIASGRVMDSEEFSAALDGEGDGSPKFQTFPHESTALNLLIEQDDDLCTNCHHPNQLP